MPEQARIDAVVCLALVLAGTALAASLFLAGGCHGAPRIHDEFAYLLQAKMLASGHLTEPSPPLPEFFETAHVLLVPRYAAKYFPGHAALLAPFVPLGVPWLLPCLLLGGTCALLFLGLRLSGFARGPALVAPLLLLGSADVLPVFASYFSQASTCFWVSGAVVAAALSSRRPALGAALLGLCAGWAGLTRPFTGLALAAAAAGLLLTRRETRQPRIAFAFGVPLLAAAGLALVCCHATTGSWTRSPWSLYAAQYTPADGPGFGPVREAAPLRALPPYLKSMGRGFEAARRSYSAGALLDQIPRRAHLVVDELSAPVLALVVLGLFAMQPALWMGLAFAFMDFALLLDFHTVFSLYLVDVRPALLLVAAAGAARAFALIATLRPPALRAALAAAAALVLVWVAAGSARSVRERIELAHWSGTDRTAAYAAPLAEVRAQRGLVFLRYPADWNGNYDLTYNEPDLATAPLVRAIDLGPRDAELMRFFPDRPAFLLDLETARLTRLPSSNLVPLTAGPAADPPRGGD